MLYTPSHAELGEHPKTKKLARLLGVSIPTALGHLHLLWHFTLKYAPDGDLTRFDADDIAEGCMWDSDAAVLLAALTQAKWLNCDDETTTIHDWHEHGGKYVQRKEANAQRMKEARAKHQTSTKKVRATHVQRTSRERVEPEESRVEERREEKSRVEDIASGAHAPERDRNLHWDALVAGIGSVPLTDAEQKRYGRVVERLKQDGITPDQIATACRNYSSHIGNAAMTPEAILKHFSLLQTVGPRTAARIAGGDQVVVIAPNGKETRVGRKTANNIEAIRQSLGERTDQIDF